MMVAGMLVASALPASADAVTPACPSAPLPDLASPVVNISLAPRGFGEIGLTTANGERYLLAGVVVPASARPGERRELVEQLRALLEKPLQVQVLDEAPDRRGRRQVSLFTGDVPITAHLAAAGLVVASGEPCSGAVLAAEIKARQGQRGLWQNPSFLHDANDTDMDLPDFAIINGDVLSVGQSGRTTYLNFGTLYRRDVTVRVPDAMREALTASGLDVAALGGRRVEVRGYWMVHDGPELVLQHVEALLLPALAGRGN